MRKDVVLAVVAAGAILQSPLTAQQPQPFVRDPKIAIDADYTKKIKEYTTEPFFTSPLVDYLPASKTIPTPKEVLGDVAGAPGRLPYAEEVYQYMRLLEKASPRVKVYSIGKTEEGREMIAVAIASEQVMARLQDNSARLAKLADPRTINMDDAQAEKLLDGTVPVYYITSEDETDDMRPGLGWMGVAHLQDFVKKGGVLVTVMDTADLAVDSGFTPGLSIAPRQRLRIVGSVVRSKTINGTSPIAYGYTDNLAIWCDNGPIFNLSNSFGARGGRRLGPDDGGNRPTGRGTADDPDTPQGRLGIEVPAEPRTDLWQAVPVTDEQLRNGINVIPPAMRPRVILRYADTRELLVSGLVEAGGEIAQHAAVVDVPLDKGHVVAFSNNPIWRGETEGSYFLVFNTLLNFDALDAGRKLDAR